MFARTCQECGHIQQSREPTTEQAADDKFMLTYSQVKCAKCKSEALDFGHGAFHQSRETGKIVRND